MQKFSSLLSWRLFKAQHVSGVFPPIIRSSMTVAADSGFTFVSWWQSCCDRGRAGRHVYHDNMKVKQEGATAFIELLMMGGKRSETCWAVNKRQDNKLESCCIWLVIYLNCTMMQGLTNLKFNKISWVILVLVCIRQLEWSLCMNIDRCFCENLKQKSLYINRRGVSTKNEIRVL
jgi:hypothetical protein